MILYNKSPRYVPSHWVKCLLWLGSFAVIFLGCSQPLQPKTDLNEGPRHVVIMHTNDIHGEALSPSLEEATANTGGFIALSQAVAQVRQQYPNALLLDAGDLMTGTPASVLPYGGVEGGRLIALMNALNYDASTLGNHEFDKGQGALQDLLGMKSYPTILSNLHHVNGDPLFGLTKDYLIIEQQGLRIGIVGLMTHELPKLAAVTHLESLALTSPTAAAQHWVRALDKETDILILLTHQGLEQDRKLAAQVPGIDVIVGGHSHSALATPQLERDTIIVQAGSQLKHLGLLELWVDDDKVLNFTGQLIPLGQSSSEMANSEVLSLIDGLQKQVHRIYGQVLGELKTPFVRKHSQESNVGNWIADQLRESAQTDIAVINSGGIRQDLAAGPLTKGDLKALMPFDNQLATFEVNGLELKQILKHNAELAHQQSYGILQVSGLSYAWKWAENETLVGDVFVQGQPIKDTQVYSIASNDYIVFAQYHKHLGLVPRAAKRSDASIFDILLEATQKSKIIEATVNGRIIEASP